ncbi:MAG: hypothetical protein ACRD4C_08725 [Candidatus Acidiferrales bacterium]
MTPRIKTTCVGSYPVPSWLIGNTSRLVLRDAVMTVLKTLTPTTLLAMFNSPQLGGVAQEVEDTIVKIMKEAAAG